MAVEDLLPSTAYCLFFGLRFVRVAFCFIGAAVVTVAGWTFATVTLPGSTVVLLLSSMVGLGEAMTCCSCCCCRGSCAEAPESAAHAERVTSDRLRFINLRSVRVWET